MTRTTTLSASSDAPSLHGKISALFELSKSGIVSLVLISVLGGYLIGQPSELPVSWARMTMTLVGVLFLASGSSALNQIQEISEDAKMPRTSKRPLPSGRISTLQAWIFISITLITGLIVLTELSTTLFILGIIAVLSYNGLYTLWWKRHWSYAAVPGAIPGALPILMGHLSAQGNISSPSGWFLFFLLFFWQMPHFWALALRYRDDYKSGNFPTLPVTHGTEITVSRIVLWCLAYVGIAILGPLFLKVSGFYCIVTFLMSAKILWELRKFVIQPENKSWIHFFLWVNFSLIIYISAAAADLWSIFLIPLVTQRL